MKHTTDYKFSDQIASVRDFYHALADAFSIGMVEKRDLYDKLDHYELTVYPDDGLNIQYEIRSVDDCLTLAVSRVDFMYSLSKRRYLVGDCSSSSDDLARSSL